ncbi:MAG TPA: type II toxin-antitoxin system PemK/MazF family toxin [Candidatus Acidoferrales bacterium]|nr:type II toxin-antitoxin system PemK/MazF family toxin [Candidatus Acidoferrales bacterium]
MPRSGDIIIARMQFTDSNESKIRPALVLFEELGNVVIAGITTNLQMKGVSISVKEGAAQDSVIKLNYIFTITNEAILKTVTHLGREKKRFVFGELNKKLGGLIT